MKKREKTVDWQLYFYNSRFADGHLLMVQFQNIDTQVNIDI